MTRRHSLDRRDFALTMPGSSSTIIPTDRPRRACKRNAPSLAQAIARCPKAIDIEDPLIDLTHVGFLSTLSVGFLQRRPAMPRRQTLRQKIERRIARRKGDDVFLTREFTNLGGEDQVLRALRRLVEDGRLVRLGYGVYGRATVSRLSGR